MQKKLSVSFNSVWVLSKKDDAVLPVDAFVNAVKKALEIEVLSSSLTDCDILIKNFDDTVMDTVEEIIKAMAPDGAAKYSLTDYISEAKQEEKREVKQEQPVNQVQEVMDRINSLVGAEEFKEMAEEYVKIAPRLIKCNTADAITKRSFLFSVNNGCGLTTCLNLLGELFNALGIFEFKEGNIIERKYYPKDSDKAKAFNERVFEVGGYGKNGGRIF